MVEFPYWIWVLHQFHYTNKLCCRGRASNVCLWQTCQVRFANIETPRSHANVTLRQTRDAEDVAPYNEKYYVFVGADSISARLFLSHCTPHPSAFGCHLLPLEKAWDRVDIESTPTEKEYIRSVGEGLAPPVFMESNICVVTDC